MYQLYAFNFNSIRVSSSGTSGASFFTGKLANQIRDKNGNYIAVASRGNLFLTWTPGQDYWIPHNRGSSRYIFCLNTNTTFTLF